MRMRSFFLVMVATILGVGLIACAQAATGKDDAKPIEKKVTVKVKADSSNVVDVVIIEDGETRTLQLDRKTMQDLVDWEDILSDLSELDSLRHFTFEMPGLSANRTLLGVSVQRMTSQLREFFKVNKDGGILVVEVVPESPAEKAGIRAGDVITAVGDAKIENPGDLTAAIGNFEPGDKVTIHLIRDKKSVKLTAELARRPGGDLRMPRVFKHKDIRVGSHFLPYAHQDDLKEELESLRKELDELRAEMEKLRKR